MEKEIWVVSIDNDIKGYVNSFQEGLDYIKKSNWFNKHNTYEDWRDDWDDDLKKDYPTFDSLYNMLEEDQGYFWEMFDGGIDIFEIRKLIVEKE